MNRTTAIIILLFAAALEAGGDAVIRVGLHTNTAWHRSVLFAAAAIILFACSPDIPLDRVAGSDDRTA